MKNIFKLKKGNKKNKNNSGMTLIEVIIAMTIFVVMTDMLLSAVIVTLNTNKDTLLTNEYVNAQVNSFSSFNSKKVEPTAFSSNINNGSDFTDKYKVSLGLKDPANGTAKKGDDADWAIFDGIKCKSYSVNINSATNASALTENADIKHGYFDNATYGNSKLDDFAQIFSLNFIQAEEFTPWLSSMSNYWYSWVRVHNKVDIGGTTPDISVKLEIEETNATYNETYLFTKSKIKGGDGNGFGLIVFANSDNGIGCKFYNSSATKSLKIMLKDEATGTDMATATFDATTIDSIVGSNDGYIDICIYFDDVSSSYKIVQGTDIP